MWVGDRKQQLSQLPGQASQSYSSCIVLPELDILYYFSQADSTSQVECSDLILTLLNAKPASSSYVSPLKVRSLKLSITSVPRFHTIFGSGNDHFISVNKLYLALENNKHFCVPSIWKVLKRFFWISKNNHYNTANTQQLKNEVKMLQKRCFRKAVTLHKQPNVTGALAYDWGPQNQYCGSLHHRSKAREAGYLSVSLTTRPQAWDPSICVFAQSKQAGASPSLRPPSSRRPPVFRHLTLLLQQCPCMCLHV